MSTPQFVPRDQAAATDDLRNQVASFDPQQFISDLVAASLSAAEASRQGYEALSSSEGRASEGIVDVAVAPTGELRSLRLGDEPASTKPETLSADIMKAYRRAAAAANSQVASHAGPELGPVISASVDESIAAQRIEEGVTAPDPMAPNEAAPLAPTVADLPPDPVQDELLAILDDPDPFRAVERLRADPRIPHVDLRGSAADIDAQIAAEFASMSDRARELEPQLRALRGIAENADGRVEVNAWGGLTSVSLSPSIRTQKAAALEKSLTVLIAEATEHAARDASALLRGSGLSGSDDPTLASLERLGQENDQ